MESCERPAMLRPRPSPVDREGQIVVESVSSDYKAGPVTSATNGHSDSIKKDGPEAADPRQPEGHRC